MINRGTKVFQNSTDADQLKDVTKNAGSPTVLDTFGLVRKLKIQFNNFRIATTDTPATSGNGSQKLWTFPEGVIQILGSLMNIGIAKEGAGISATAAVVASVGSAAAAADATLTGTEADLVASTAGTLVAGVNAAVAKHGSMVATAFDGHTTPMAVFLNFAIPDADSTANDALIVNGSVTVYYYYIGDY